MPNSPNPSRWTKAFSQFCSQLIRNSEHTYHKMNEDFIKFTTIYFIKFTTIYFSWTPYNIQIQNPKLMANLSQFDNINLN